MDIHFRESTKKGYKLPKSQFFVIYFTICNHDNCHI